MMRKKQTTDITASNNNNYNNNNNNNKNSDLPFDLVFDILTRLPVKSLLQFKTICKTWYSLVQNPTFIKLHLSRSKLNTVSSLLVTNYERRLFTMRLLLFRDKPHVPVPNPHMIFEHYPLILGICDGLVCATFENSETIICNPTIRHVRNIPRFCLPEIRSAIFRGFGLKDDDYKLFRIVYPISGDEVVVRAEVYSMNTGIWREIGVNTEVIDPRVRRRCLFLEPVAINEVFYWNAYSVGFTCVVYSFDMNGYVFGMITFPEEFTKLGQCHNGPIDFKGELAFTRCFNYQWFEMWVMNKTERSWTMRLKVDNLPSIGRSLSVLGCDRNGSLLMRHKSQDSGLKLFSYDPENHTIRYLPFADTISNGDVCMYTESLLPVSQLKGKEANDFVEEASFIV